MTNKQVNDLLKEQLKDTKFKFKIVGSNDKPLVILKYPIDMVDGDPLYDMDTVAKIHNDAKNSLGEKYSVTTCPFNIKVIKTKGEKNILSYSVPYDKCGIALIEDVFIDAWTKHLEEKCPKDYVLVRILGGIEVVE